MMKFFLLILFLVTKLAHSSDQITFSGYQCEGDEMTAARLEGKWADYSCSRKEWFIQIESYAPFIGKLKISAEKNSEFYTYYNIVPTIPVGPEIRWILRQHWVRVSPDGVITVVHK
jgi:hypothetical protein